MFSSVPHIESDQGNGGSVSCIAKATVLFSGPKIDEVLSYISKLLQKISAKVAHTKNLLDAIFYDLLCSGFESVRPSNTKSAY